MDSANNQSGDRLLWLAAGVVALMGAAWLIVAAPWSDPDAGELDDFSADTDFAADAVAPAVDRVEPQIAPAARSESSGSDPLYMARMALEAGMLTEPADYSAWTLFGRAAAAEPGNTAARDGLLAVADALVQRGNAALEQGRFDDAGTVVATIGERFPEHAGALTLAAEVERALRPPPPVRTAPARQETAREAPARVDPIPDMNRAFRDAMALNAVLQPAGTSAVDIVKSMLSEAPDHELTIAARDLLVTEMLDRSKQSIEALDVRAAQTWIDSAAPLTSDAAAIERAQSRLTAHLIETESQRLLPTSALNQLTSAAPEYPRIPLERGIEGWVELEFVVTPAGLTDSIAVTDASHDRYFREEAIAAVARWQFEPTIFMGQPISRRSFTRLAFVLD
jgi:TonB family protein